MNLTKPQKLIYDMEKYAGGAISVICGGMLICGEKEISEMQRAVNELYRLNDALRIRIIESGGTVRQEITEYAEKSIPVLRFENKAELDAYAEKYAKTPLDLNGDLCKINVVAMPGQYGLLAKLHHIIGDAWTLSLLGTQFNKLMNGEAVEAYSYADYACAEEKYIQSKRYERDKAFFIDEFKRCDEVTYINEKKSDSLEAKRKTFVIDKEFTGLINGYAEGKGTSAFVLFTAALSAYISRTKMNADKFYIGTAVLNRSGNKEQNTVGMFINTVPMLIELDNDKSFSENLSRMEETALSVFRHERYNYGDVLADIRKEFNFGEKLYDVMISYQNARVGGAEVETTWYHSGEQSESLQIHIDDRDGEGVFRVHYDYLTEKFTETEIENMHSHICNLLFDAIKNDGKRIYELNILTPEEREKLLYTFNDTAVDYPRDKCVHRLFEEQAERTPDKTAVVACDKTLTYRELNEEANRIAHSLIEKGIGVGDIVAFALPRRSCLIAAMLGILKSGAAYLPIDPDYPQDRIDYMLDDSKAKLYITEEDIDPFLENSNISDPNVSMTNESLCYCIYTSGSTGKPKGVIIRHRNIINFCSNNSKNYFQKNLLDNTGYVLALNSVVFDITVQEIHLPILNGSSVLLFSEKESMNIESSHNRINNKNGGLIVTPTKLLLYMKNTSFCKKMKFFSVIMSGAESYPEYLLDYIKKFTTANIFNGYGPTETTCGVTYSSVQCDTDITIGKPIANTQIYIVDKYMKICPIGVTGELCIAGDGVGAGYLNRPELTAEKFIDNPFGEGKLYKTGDLAYWREDGNIVYVGRNDFQVKIRGLRIELGEIENAINSVDGVSQSVVVVRKDETGRQLICAFYTGEEKSAREIKTVIGEKLPKYMLPHIFTHLEKMPMTPSGKVNRKGLPEVELNDIESSTEYATPEGEIEKELAKEIGEVLNYSPVGRNDNFFDLGGDSLKAIELVSKAHSNGIYFDLQNIFDYPTVKELREHIESGDKQSVSFDDVDFGKAESVLSRNTVEQMSKPKKTDVGNILLAGATGFLGIHILADYLDSDSGTAYCFVRGKDKEESTDRLKNLLNFYFGDKYDDMSRIEVVCADLQKEGFALSAEEYEKLAKNADTVINCAASVKHYGSYKYFYEVNVETVKRLIKFCKESNAKLIHTSTLSVSGNSFGDQFDGYISSEEKHFCESNLYIGQPLDNVYARSKFEAEKAVLDAIADGLEANIMRMGNLTNRYSDGLFQKNHESNAFLQRVKGIIELGKAPDYLIKDGIYSEFTPIDEAARAVMTITRRFNAEQTVFHINSTKVVYMKRLLEYLSRLGYDIEIVSGTEFTELLRATAKASGTQHIFETFINDMDENDRLNYESNIHIENSFTVDYLKQLGFEWNDIDFEYLKKYVEYFRKIGVLR